jgi:hypothetical protein
MCSVLDSNFPLSTHPVDIGQRSEAAILAALVQRGFTVLEPFGVNHRYDLVIDTPSGFIRAQCKTGRIRDGVILFATRSTRANTRKVQARGYRGEAELFLVFCPEKQSVYAVPVEDVADTGGFLRLDPARNGQKAGVRLARDYELR